MAKRKKTIIAGRIRKVVIYTTPEPLDTPRQRAEKSRMTSAAQKAANDKTARGRLEMKLACNFTGRDLFLTLTYRESSKPGSRAEAVQNVRAFIAVLRKSRRLRGKALRYIYVTEEKHGDGRLHHHLVISSTGHDIEEVRSLWQHGDIADIEYIGSREYDVWAGYMTKEGIEGRPVGAQLWTASKGLAKPIIQTEYVPNDTSITTPAGCHVLEREERVTEFGSYCYIKYKTPADYQDQQPAETPERARQHGLVSCL